MKRNIKTLAVDMDRQEALATLTYSHQNFRQIKTSRGGGVHLQEKRDQNVG